METSLTYAQRGETRDRARFHLETKYTVWQPAPSDLNLDDVLASYTQNLNLVGGDRRPRLYDCSSYDDDEDRYSYASTTRRSRDGRINEPVYPGVYAGSRSQYPKAIEYLPRADSDIDSRLSRRSQRQTRDAEQPFETLRYVDEVREQRPPLRRYEDDKMSVWPEDSASQVSSRAPSEMSRGRRRRRESSMVGKSMMKAGRGYGGQSVIYEDDEYGYDEQPRGGGYMTKDITPYVAAR